ncbi:hypothetical protein ABMA27_014343 [Loxostege sticticalis]|uniref:Uncharacterized protein n=1 Tax=Loxostege sticticalis TaxID=481309 RepID=A0ABR3I8Q7_LOXSC
MVSCSVMDCSTTQRHNPLFFSFHIKCLQTRGAKQILMKSAIPTNIVPGDVGNNKAPPSTSSQFSRSFILFGSHRTSLHTLG